MKHVVSHTIEWQLSQTISHRLFAISSQRYFLWRRSRMGRERLQHDRRQRSLMVGLLGLSLLGLGACSGQQPAAPAPTVTPDHVRSHAGQAFEKMKQEERNRAVDPAAAP
jgi:hypothetical protein